MGTQAEAYFGSLTPPPSRAIMTGTPSSGEGAMDTKAAGILGVCIVVAGVIVSLAARIPPPPGGEVGPSQFPRSNGGNCFVLDTRTGRLWQGLVSPTSNESP